MQNPAKLPSKGGSYECNAKSWLSHCRLKYYENYQIRSNLFTIIHFLMDYPQFIHSRRTTSDKSDLLLRVFAQFRAGDLPAVHGIGAVCKPQRALPRPGHGQRRVLTDPLTAMHLHRFIDDF